MSALMPDLEVDRDILIAGALCHDIGKPWEFDPENRRRWEGDPRAAGLPSIRHPAFGVHVCFTAGLPEEVAHCAAAHSGEGELLVRSLENTIVHHADYAFWGMPRRRPSGPGDRRRAEGAALRQIAGCERLMLV